MLDDATLKLLTNREVLAIDQNAVVRGRQVHVFEQGDLRVWQAEAKSVQRRIVKVLALFNLGDAPHFYNLTDFPRNPIDVWTGKILPDKTIGAVDRIGLTIPPHGCVFIEQR
jgi:hypothetical protein